MLNHNTYQEIKTQSDALAKTLEVMSNKEFKEEHPFMNVFTGCGTSYYLAIAAARFYQEVTGEAARAVPASEIFMNPGQFLVPGKKHKIIAISRSGSTSEVISALKSLSHLSEVSTLAITCKTDSDMSRLADETISLDHVREKSVVMTQSFSSMYYALQMFAAKVSKKQTVLDQLKEVPSYAEQLIDKSDELKAVADNLNFKRFVFLGSGIFNGIACEATLKLKEMTQTECETYTKLEFRHGPISIVNNETVAVLLSEKKTKELDKSLLKDIKSYGGYTVAVGNVYDQDLADRVVTLGTKLSDLTSSVLIMPVLQMLAYHRAVKHGLNPDRPRNLNQVVKITLPN